MNQIPTILKGDDATGVSFSIAEGRNYAGCTLVVAYQGVTRTYSDLVPGESVAFDFTHDETASFRLGCYPVLARLIGADGSVETISNAEWRVKVTDVLAEVRPGDGFIVRRSFVPATDVGEIGSRFTLADVAAKVNELVRVLAQSSAVPALTAALACLSAFGAEVQTARLDGLYNDASVVTNVTFDGLVAGDYETVSNKAMNAAAAYKDASELISCSWERQGTTVKLLQRDSIAEWHEREQNTVREIAYDGAWFYRRYHFRLGPPPDWKYTNTTSRAATKLTFGEETFVRCDEVWGGDTNKYPVVYADAFAAVSNVAMNAAAQSNAFLRLSGGNVTNHVTVSSEDRNEDVLTLESSIEDTADAQLGFSWNGIDWWFIRNGSDILRLPRRTGTFALREDVDAIPPPDYSPANTTLVATIEEVAPEPDLSGYSTTGDLAALAAEVAPAVAAYPRVYSFMTGATNANFVVTNYQLTAEADDGRTHFDPADPDLDFATVPASLRLEDASSGTNRVVCDTRDWTVWYFAQKIGGAINTAFTNAVATCRAWCGFTATGLKNPVPDTLIVDVPNIWLMAGKTFEKHVAGTNSCWVIRSKDTVVPISDNSQSAGGFLELTDAFGKPYIRFNKSESYFIDPRGDGIEYDAATGAWCVAYPTKNKPKGGANAVLEGSATYPGKAVLKGEDDPDCPATITWTGSAGAWVMNAEPKAVGGVVPSLMILGAVIEVEGQDYIEYLRPMSIPHLLVDGVKIAPVVPATHPAGTTVTWKVVE